MAQTISEGSGTIPVAIKVVGSQLFWSLNNGSKVRKCQTDLTGAMDAVPATVGPNPFFVVPEGGHTYYTYQGASDADGGVSDENGDPVALGQMKPSGLTVDATHIYWLSDNGLLQRQRLGLTGADMLQPPDPGSIFNDEIVDDATHVYWMGVGVHDCTSPASGCAKVLRAEKASFSSVEVFAKPVPAGAWEDVNCIGMDDAAVYFTTGKSMQPGRLFRRAKQAQP
jgi:hypothetical protein